MATKTMRVEDLIERLKTVDPTAKIAIEGQAETAWALREVVDDDSGFWVVLCPGDRLPDLVLE